MASDKNRKSNFQTRASKSEGNETSGEREREKQNASRFCFFVLTSKSSEKDEGKIINFWENAGRMKYFDYLEYFSCLKRIQLGKKYDSGTVHLLPAKPGKREKCRHRMR